MSTTKLTLLAALICSSWATARAEAPPAWKGKDFIMEEVVVRAEPLPGFYMEEVVVTAKAPPNLYMEEIVVTAKVPGLDDLEESIVNAVRPHADIHPGKINPPALPDQPNTGQPGTELSVLHADVDEPRAYAARDEALRARRLF